MRVILAVALLAASCEGAADPALVQSGRDVESYLPGFPRRAVTALAELVPRTPTAPPAEQWFINGLYGQALVQSGRTSDALAFADRLEAAALAARDVGGSTTALLIRSSAAYWAGNTGSAITLAMDARRYAKEVGDPFLLHWAALAIGGSARHLGQYSDASRNLREALAYADEADDVNRRSAVRYQLAMLDVALKQPAKGLEQSDEAFAQARRSNNVYAMVRAKVASSELFGALEESAKELASLKEAVSIARSGGSRVAEALALVKLSDLHLRRRDYVAVQDVARQSLAALQDVDDFALLATAKANMGFALLAVGKTEDGRRYADAALADWERSQSTSGVTWLLGKYTQYLATAGDFKSALAMSEQERAWAIRHEAERHRHEVELLNRDNALQAAELQNQRLQQAIAWGLALVTASFLLLTAILYHKLKTINHLEAERNERLRVQSTHDPLTGLYNRRHFENIMERDPLWPERRRSGDERVVHVLLLIDLDHFKQINDRYGHATGDAVLVEAARRLQSTLRESDVCVRWGGEEFLIFVPATGADSVHELAKRVIYSIGGAAIAVEGAELRVTGSIGYLPLPLSPGGIMLSWQRAVGLADQACYMAKRLGRNRAFGIDALATGGDDILKEVERDLQGAAQRGLVAMHEIAGPADAAHVRDAVSPASGTA